MALIPGLTVLQKTKCPLSSRPCKNRNPFSAQSSPQMSFTNGKKKVQSTVLSQSLMFVEALIRIMRFLSVASFNQIQIYGYQKQRRNLAMRFIMQDTNITSTFLFNSFSVERKRWKRKRETSAAQLIHASLVGYSIHFTLKF